jgi:antitoxin component YwqK of YwqJK toxin-antitoxin module
MKLLLLTLLLYCFNLSNAQEGDTLNKYGSDGLRTGKWVYRRAETGKISSIEYYTAGKRNGLCIYYDKNGRLESEIEYRDGLIHGTFRFYSPTGRKEVAQFVNGKREGFTRYYNYKGELTDEDEYRTNVRNGVRRIYSARGRVVMETTYVNGSENGTRRSYKDNEKKELVLEADFVNDKRTEIRYYKNGKLIKTIKDDPALQQTMKE